MSNGKHSVITGITHSIISDERHIEMLAVHLKKCVILLNLYISIISNIYTIVKTKYLLYCKGHTNVVYIELNLSVYTISLNNIDAIDEEHIVQIYNKIEKILNGNLLNKQDMQYLNIIYGCIIGNAS